LIQIHTFTALGTLTTTRDSFGRDIMDKTMFFQAWFELADIWTEVIDAEEYASFLRIILGAFTFLNEDGMRVFREDKDVLLFTQAQKKYVPTAGGKPGGAGKDDTSKGGNIDDEVVVVTVAEDLREDLTGAAAASEVIKDGIHGGHGASAKHRKTIHEKLASRASAKAEQSSRQTIFFSTMCRYRAVLQAVLYRGQY
jgi:hypothetical protein